VLESAQGREETLPATYADANTLCWRHDTIYSGHDAALVCGPLQ